MKINIDIFKAAGMDLSVGNYPVIARWNARILVTEDIYVTNADCFKHIKNTVKATDVMILRRIIDKQEQEKLGHHWE